jgi:hypothetical protein
MFSRNKKKQFESLPQDLESLRIGTLQNVLEEGKAEGRTKTKKSGRTETVPIEEIPRILKEVYGQKDPDQEAQLRLVSALTEMLKNQGTSYKENEGASEIQD